MTTTNSDTITAILVDDEEGSRKVLRWALQKFCPQVHLIGEGASPEEAKELIIGLSPDLVFLDIDLSGSNAFDLLKSLPERNFEIIFVTAFNEYALKAIKVAALDYLTKPVNPEELQIAVRRASELLHKRSLSAQLELLTQAISPVPSLPSKIALPLNDGIRLIQPDQILYCQSDRNYTRFVLKTGEKILLSKTLKEFEYLESYPNFIRIHRSSIINSSAVEKYTKGQGGQVTLSDGTVLEVSKSKKNDLLAALGIAPG